MATMSPRGYWGVLVALAWGVILWLPATAVAGTLIPSPTSLEFSSVPVGATQVKAVTLTNAETTTTIGAGKLEGEEPTGQFAIEPSPGSDCEGQEIEVGHSCVFEIIFHPTSAGEKRATLRVESNATNNPILVSLVGVSIASELSIAPSPFDFGTFEPGSKSAAQEFVVENTGTEPTAIESVALTGADSDQFPITADGCSMTNLGAGSDCSVSVVFAPTSAGAKAATLEVPASPFESAKTVALSGTGAAAAPGGGGAPAPAPAAPAKPSNAFGFGKVIHIKDRGTASLPVRVPGPGSLLLGGKGLIARSGPGSALVLGGAGTVRLAIVASEKKAAALDRTGRTKIVARVTYTPSGGAALTKTKKIGLVKRR
jgi:hypothetical protein